MQIAVLDDDVHQLDLLSAFHRGGTGAPSAGLGLAFVQAIVRHHGGQAGWFFIELPAGAAG